jgi:hypothetical protein
MQMMIRLETSAATGIDNEQRTDISVYDRNLAERFARKHPWAKPRTTPSAMYNCHGMTFASPRTRITDVAGISRIVGDDKWIEIAPKEVLPGDIVVYYDYEGDANHSVVVVASENLLVPLTCSKWGSGPEFDHSLSDCPNIYGPETKFYQCRLGCK